MDSPDDKGGRYDSTRQAWEDIWEEASVQIELEAIQYERAQETLLAYLPYLSKDDLHLEAGSGLGAVVIEMKRLGYDVVGLDYAINAISRTKDFDASLPLLVGDVHALPFENDSLGSYLSFGVLEHFEHGMQPALNEAYRVLKPSGVVVLTIPYPNVVYKIVQWRRSQSGTGQLNNDEFYESVYTRDELIQNVKEAGFDIELVRPTSHAFTLWGLGNLFQADGYYKTSPIANSLGGIFKRIMPWQFNFMTLIIGRK